MKFHLSDKFCSREDKYFVILCLESQPNFLKSSTYMEVPLMWVPLKWVALYLKLFITASTHWRFLPFD